MLIGVSSYVHLEPLPAVANNLPALADILTSGGSWNLPPGHCTVVAEPDSTPAMLDAVEQAAEVAEDTLLVYFAGHGLLDGRGELFFGLPRSAAGRSHTGVTYQALREILADTPAQRHVIILDCCLSGRALGSMSSDEMLADQAEIEGTYLLAAAPDNGLALAPPGDIHTAFTGELLRILRDGIPGTDLDLDLDLVYRHLRAALSARGLPQPQKRVRNTAGRLIFARNHAYRPAPADGPADPAQGSAEVQLRLKTEALTDSSNKITELKRQLSEARAKLKEARDELDRERRQHQNEKALVLRRAVHREEQLKHAGALVRDLESELAEERSRSQQLETELDDLNGRQQHASANPSSLREDRIRFEIRQGGHPGPPRVSVLPSHEDFDEPVCSPSTQVNRVAAAARSTTADEAVSIKSTNQTGATSTGKHVPAPDEAVAPSLPQPAAWAQPGDTEGFMQELRQLWQESRASKEALYARGLESKRVDRILRANSLPASYLPFVKALVEACGRDPLRWEANWAHVGDWPETDWGDPSARSPRFLLDSVLVAVRILTRAIGFGAFLSAPVFVYLNAAAYVAACRAENGPSWLSLLGWAIAGIAFSASGWFVLTVIALVITEDTDASDAVSFWSLIGSVIALFAGLVLPVAADLSEPGNWWAYTLGVLYS
ncbi:caspase family protein [Streptomyces sp. NBC_00882]|uniref:caspase family protein n=1 Tax=Streptomyces TaxID=1883 RepID=UPI0038707362|nr:caspase family protein [Streptomyces sp. NBC_00882]WSZ62051.1 caspase family protein [Streptomyces canus]